MTANVVWIIAMTQRPAMRELHLELGARSADSREKRSPAPRARPIVLPSRIPETDSDSSTSVEMSASVRCCVAVIARRCLPTRRVRKTKKGSSPSEKTARRQSSRNIATTVAITVVRFETIEVAVDVTTVSTPPMSFAIRDWISPVRVRVKNASESRCRWR